MKTKRIAFIGLITILVIFVVSMNSCKKDDNQINQTNGRTSAVFNANLIYGTMLDQDGNIYKTITIGTQIWMAENLRTTKYRNGDKISQINKDTDWVAKTTGAYSNYNNTENLDSIATLGRLYNGYAISDRRNICPSGWHIPSDEEWGVLINNLGGENSAGDKMKQIGWQGFSNNISGFTAVPSGIRNFSDGSFEGIFDFGYSGFSKFWSASEYIVDCCHNNFTLGSNVSALNKGYSGNRTGLSIRCIKD